MAIAEDGAGAAEHAFNRFGAGVKEPSHLVSLPAQHVAQDQRRPLLRGESLQRRHERQPNALARHRDIGGVAVGGEHPVIVDRADPHVLGQGSARQRIARRRRADLHRQRPPAAGLEHVDADIGGDSEQPRPQRRPPLEAVECPPGPHERLLHGVLGLERRAEHAVAVAGQGHAMLLELVLQLPDVFGDLGHGASSDGRGRCLAAAAVMQATYPKALS